MPGNETRQEQVNRITKSLPPCHLSSACCPSSRQARSLKANPRKGPPGPLRTRGDGVCLLKQCSIRLEEAGSQNTHMQGPDQRRIKFDFPSCLFLGDRERARQQPPGVPGCSPGTVPSSMALPLSDTPATAATPDAPTRPEEERRRQLAPGSVREHWSKAVRNVGRRDRARRRVRERFKSRAFPALASPVLREHPCCRPSSSSSPASRPPARPPALPSQPPPQALKDTAARWPATPGRPRVEGSRRAPWPARGSPRRPALPGAALAHRPVLLVRPVAADAQPGKAAGSQRSAAAGAPTAAPGAEQ